MSFIYDSSLLMKDAGSVSGSAAATVSAVAKVHDTGGGFTKGMLVIDATAVEVDSGDEMYTIALQGSDSATFAGDIVLLASVILGDAVPLVGNVDKGAGRYFAPFTNQYGDTVFRYLRVYTTVVGTVISGGVTYSAFLSK